MAWRCANNRRAMRSIEPYLGDVCGEPMRLPLTPPRRRWQQPRWVERGVRAVVLTFGITVGSVLLIAVILSMFLAVAHG
jgi:hypothetical protein